MPIHLNKRVVLLLALVALTIIIALKKDDLQKLFTQQSSPTSDNKITSYYCPTIGSFCTSGQDLIQDKAYLGFKGDIASQSAILASFDGELTAATTLLTQGPEPEELVTLYLDNKENKVRAIYYFKGDSSAPKHVYKGEVIGTSLSQIRAFNTSLIFQVIKGDLTSGEKVKLSSKDFTF